MFKSFPAVNHVQYRLTADGDVTRLKFTHRAMGPIPAEFRENIGMGWDYGLNRIAAIASGLVAKLKAMHQMIHYGQLADACRAAGREPYI